MRRSWLSAALVLTMAASVAPAAAQSSETKSASIEFRPQWSAEGYEMAFVDVSYGFAVCGGDIRILYRLEPETFRVSDFYRTESGLVRVPDGVQPPPVPNGIVFSGYVRREFDPNEIARFRDENTIAYEGAGCYGQSKVLGKVSDLVGANASRAEVESFLNDLMVTLDTNPGIRNPDVQRTVAAAAVRPPQQDGTSGAPRVSPSSSSTELPLAATSGTDLPDPEGTESDEAFGAKASTDDADPNPNTPLGSGSVEEGLDEVGESFDRIMAGAFLPSNPGLSVTLRWERDGCDGTYYTLSHRIGQPQGDRALVEAFFNLGHVGRVDVQQDGPNFKVLLTMRGNRELINGWLDVSRAGESQPSSSSEVKFSAFQFFYATQAEADRAASLANRLTELC